MAIGDLVGELASLYMTPAQRAAQLAKSGAKQTSFDVTNTPGVVGRASQQAQPISLSSLSPAGAAATPASTAPTQSMSLASLAPGGATPAQQPAPAPLSLASAGQKQTSFDQTNTAAKYMQPNQPQSLASLAPVGVLPTATSPTYPAPAQQRAADLRDAGPTDTPLPAPMASLESAYRPTGVGQGSNAIAGRIGTSGTAEFSNAPTDLASAAGLARLNTAPQQQASTGPVSLADIMPGTGAAPGSNADFASLGSARNLGDGIGTFSQANAGDSALAMGRFQKANDLRAGYQAEDAAKLAAYRARQGASINVVRDSSQPYTREDKALDLRDAMKQQGLEANAAGAQKSLEDLRTGQANARDVVKTQRLEDIMTAGTAPNATPEQRAAVQRIQDPTGEKAAALQLTQAKIAETNAASAKLTAEASGETPEARQKATAAAQKAQLDQLDIEKRKTDAAQAAQNFITQKTGSIDIAREAQQLTKDISSNKRLGDVTGPINSRLPITNGDSQDLVNKALRLQSLLTVDNLKLMSGVLTDKDIAFLGQIGSGLNIGDNGIRASEQGTKDRLAEISTKLGAKITDYDKANPAKVAAAAASQEKQAVSPSPAAVSSPVQISTEQAYAALPSGAQYIDPQGNHRSKP